MSPTSLLRGGALPTALAGLAFALVCQPCASGASLQRTAVASQPLTDLVIDGVRYRKLSTRSATRQRMLDLLTPSTGQWGDFWLASPFPYAGHDRDALSDPTALERELSKMRAGGPGPDLDASWVGRDGIEVRWQHLGEGTDRRVDLRVHEDERLNDNGSCYLYATVESDADRDVELTLGSDDGILIWFNGEKLFVNDVPRGLDPQADRVRFPLRAGTNHFLAKVGQGAGGWDFQINTRLRLSDRADALLTEQLDRDFPPSPEWRYWRKSSYVAPAGTRLEIGGIDFLPDGRPIVSTRRGDVWIVENADAPSATEAHFTQYASGLHEALGLAVREEGAQVAVYVMQRPELTRMVDRGGDDRADLFQTFNDDFGVSGNYHEFAFGPKFDREGNAWISLNVGFCGALGKSTVPYRGWALKVRPDGELVPVASGLRSPNGMGMNAAGEMFYVDNQGDWVGTNRLSHLREGSWHGHPSSVHWRDDHVEGGPLPEREPAAVWFPYPEMGQSAADICLVEADGELGPYDGQMLVGDQMRATVMRVFLEEVDGFWQGACLPFLTGFDSGVNRMAVAPDGSLYVGMTDRGWGSVGRRREGLQRVVWSGRTPLDLRELRLVPGGFELEFTRPLDPRTAASPASYSVDSHTYLYHVKYGSPKVEEDEHAITQVDLVDERTVRLHLDRVRDGGFVHQVVYDGVRGAGGREPIHDRAWYTVERLRR